MHFEARAGGAVGATVPAATGVSIDAQRQQQQQQQQRRSKYVIQQLFALMRQRLPPEKYDQVRRAVQSSKVCVQRSLDGIFRSGVEQNVVRKWSLPQRSEC